MTRPPAHEQRLRDALIPGPFQPTAGWTHVIASQHLADLRQVLTDLAAARVALATLREAHDRPLREVISDHWCIPECPPGCTVAKTRQFVTDVEVLEHRLPLTAAEQAELEAAIATIARTATTPVPPPGEPNTTDRDLAEE